LTGPFLKLLSMFLDVAWTGACSYLFEIFEALFKFWKAPLELLPRRPILWDAEGVMLPIF